MQLTFENPANLWFFCAIPVLIAAHFFFLRYIRKRALAFANFRALKRITGERLITKNYFMLVLRVLAIAVLVLAASGAVLWYEGTSHESDFVIALDSSSSMTAQDIAPTRFAAAKQDAKLFLDALDSETRVGLITFSGVTLVETIPSLQRAPLIETLGKLEPLEAGGTDIPGAIITSTNLLLDEQRGRSVILLTDGSNTIETFLDASMQRAMTYAQEHHVRVHAIGLGTNSGPIGYLPTFYNVSATYNEENLQQIANATGGIYVHATSAQELLDAFRTIAGDVRKQTLRKDLSAYLLTAALVLILLEWILSNTRYRSIP